MPAKQRGTRGCQEPNADISKGTKAQRTRRRHCEPRQGRNTPTTAHRDETQPTAGPDPQRGRRNPAQAGSEGDTRAPGTQRRRVESHEGAENPTSTWRTTQGPKHPNHSPSRRNAAQRWAASPTTMTSAQRWGRNHAQTDPSPPLDTETKDDMNPAEEEEPGGDAAQDDDASPAEGSEPARRQSPAHCWVRTPTTTNPAQRRDRKLPEGRTVGWVWRQTTTTPSSGGAGNCADTEPSPHRRCCEGGWGSEQSHLVLLRLFLFYFIYHSCTYTHPRRDYPSLVRIYMHLQKICEPAMKRRE